MSISKNLERLARKGRKRTGKRIRERGEMGVEKSTEKLV